MDASDGGRTIFLFLCWLLVLFVHQVGDMCGSQDGREGEGVGGGEPRREPRRADFAYFQLSGDRTSGVHAKNGRAPLPNGSRQPAIHTSPIPPRVAAPEGQKGDRDMSGFINPQTTVVVTIRNA